MAKKPRKKPQAVKKGGMDSPGLTGISYDPPPEIDHPKKRAWLKAFAQVGGVHKACMYAKVGVTTTYDWRRSDAAFAAAVVEAREVFTEMLEEEADRRAYHGVRRLKFHQGVPLIDPDTDKPYVEHEYSDTLLIFRLKALRPEVYRERHEVQVNEQELNAEIEALLAQRNVQPGVN